IRRGLSGSNDHNGILRVIGNMGLVRWNMEFTDVLPNVAERWEGSADSTEFTFFLRSGMKWSDGQPFGATAIISASEDRLENNELHRAPPAIFVINARLPTVTKVGDDGVRFKFAGPFGLFLQLLATPLGQPPTLFPKHYASRFHPKYNAAGLPE